MTNVKFHLSVQISACRSASVLLEGGEASMLAFISVIRYRVGVQ